ncbi:MAG: hypothetical protein ACLP5H_11270 [Desulfomonilaceae bacterium]
MRYRNRWTSLRRTKVVEGMENEERRPKKDIPKVIYAPELPKYSYGSTNEPPYVPCPMRYYDDDYDHC